MRVSSDLAGAPCDSPRSTVSPPPGGYSSHSSVSETDAVAGFSSANRLATSSVSNSAAHGLAPVLRTSSLGGLDVSKTAAFYNAHQQQQPGGQPDMRAGPRRGSQHPQHGKPASPHTVPESVFASGGGAQPMDVDLVPTCGPASSASASPPISPTADAEVIAALSLQMALSTLFCCKLLSASLLASPTACGLGRRSTADAEV